MIQYEYKLMVLKLIDFILFTKIYIFNSCMKEIIKFLHKII